MQNPQINFITFDCASSGPGTGSGSGPDSSLSAGAGSGISNRIPLIMLHGWGHSINNLRSFGELLGETGKVYLLDLPGFGSSPEPDTVWGTADYADAVLRFIDREGLGQVDLFGHSFGGRISIHLAASHPERIRRLILCNSAGIKPVPSFKKRLRLAAIRKTGAFLKAFDRISGTSLFQTRFAPRFGSADYKRASGILRNILVRTINEDLAEFLPAIRSETLLLWGRRDTETPLESGRKIQALIPASEMIVLDNHGHEPFQGVGAHLLTYYSAPFLQRGRQAIEALRGERCLVP